jgi:hypothetical protein
LPQPSARERPRPNVWPQARLTNGDPKHGSWPGWVADIQHTLEWIRWPPNAVEWTPRPSRRDRAPLRRVRTPSPPPPPPLAPPSPLSLAPPSRCSAALQPLRRFQKNGWGCNASFVTVVAYPSIGMCVGIVGTTPQHARQHGPAAATLSHLGLYPPKRPRASLLVWQLGGWLAGQLGLMPG